jgi:hypothetical protein
MSDGRLDELVDTLRDADSAPSGTRA